MSPRVGLVYDPIYLEHDTGQHVERAQRLQETMSLLEKEGVLGRLIALRPRPATLEELKLAHAPEHIARVERTAREGGGWLDADTVTSPRSYEVALYAVGGVLRAVDGVMSREVDSAFALVRPPGHHATYWQAMGFCLFNNVVIATRYALIHHRLERVLVVDWDVHHGNGTQDAFYASPHVLYFSTHQFPLYPGTGSLSEIGQGQGEGNMVNVPLLPGCGDPEYQQVFQEVLVPAARRFRPEIILVSAGYDGHWQDMLASMRLSTTGYARLATILRGLARELCQGRLILALEGGYHLQALATSVRATLEVLLGNPDIPDPLGPPPPGPPPPDISGLVQAVKASHALT